MSTQGHGKIWAEEKESIKYFWSFFYAQTSPGLLCFSRITKCKQEH